MPKLTNVDTHYVMEIAKRHQKIGWRLGILYAHFNNSDSSTVKLGLDRFEAAQLLQEIHDITAGEKDES